MFVNLQMIWRPLWFSAGSEQMSGVYSQKGNMWGDRLLVPSTGRNYVLKKNVRAASETIRL